MTREEAIAIIRKEYLCVDRDCDIERSCGRCDLMMPSKEPILQAYKMAIQALETWNNLFKSYEVLTKEITESGDINNATKRIDDWCIEQLRGIIGDHYADLIIKELEQEQMRDATPEERESVDAYIKSISKPTGTDFDSLSDSQTIHHLTDKAYSELCLLAAKGREALQPSGDAVSRQAVLDYIHRILNQGTGKKKSFEFIQKYVEKLPSVNPQEKMGHWIEEIDDYGEIQGWHCDKCYEDSGFTTTCKWDYCPNCGARMVEPTCDTCEYNTATFNPCNACKDKSEYKPRAVKE